MKIKRLKLSALFLFGFALNSIQAQQAIPAAGGNASGSGGSVSYSVGQIVYTTNAGTNGSVAQGVQQPFEISVVTGIEQANGISLQCSAYPNPATDYVKLKIENYQFENFTYQLYDFNGKILENKKLVESETSIFMGNYAPAIYFLKVIQSDKGIKTFKIIKTD